MERVRQVGRMVREGRGRVLMDVLRERWASRRLSYGLRRDLAVPFPAPAARVPVTIRPLRDSDVPALLALDAPGLDEAARDERRTRLDMIAAGLRTPYVAVTVDDRPCYMQWLLGPEENERVQAFFHGIFPRLAADEALLEGAFTPEEFRGQGIMAAAMAQLAELAGPLGARWVVTFVTADNLPSLKGCKRAGFAPYLTREESWQQFRRRLAFTPLPPGTPYPFEA